LTGCSTFCTLVRFGWPPLLLVLAIRREWNGVLALAALALIPHCVCRNPVNAWWIDRLGASPDCYAPAALVTLMATVALRSNARLALSAVAGYAIIGGVMTFFVGHHFFRIPW
jgi:hypothetical protein